MSVARHTMSYPLACYTVTQHNASSVEENQTGEKARDGKQNGNNPMVLADMVGHHFGNMTVVSRAENGWGGGTRLNCKCDCGKPFIVYASRVRSGASRQCKDCRYNQLAINFSLPNGESGKNRALRNIQKGAEYRKLTWGLSDKEAYQIMNLSCHYCGLPPSNIVKGRKYAGDFVYSGIDRRNNGLGYIHGNCVPCCKKCNYWKRELTEADFLAHAEMIVQHQTLQVAA